MSVVRGNAANNYKAEHDQNHSPLTTVDPRSPEASILTLLADLTKRVARQDERLGELEEAVFDGEETEPDPGPEDMAEYPSLVPPRRKIKKNDGSIPGKIQIFTEQVPKPSA